MEQGVATEAEIEAIQAAGGGGGRRSPPRPRSPSPQPATDTIYNFVYSPDVDPTSEQFDTEDDPRFTGEPTTMVDLLNGCMQGRDGARSADRASSARTWPTPAGTSTSTQVKGKGGVFKVTWGLQRAFGGDRVYNSPLAEANIVGRAIGLATRGLKPVVEIQFFDYIWPAYMQLRNELALMRWRSNNAFSSPVVVRVTYGGYLKGGAVYHSQTGAARLHRRCPGCGWSARRPRSTPTASSAPPSAARTRSSSSSTSTSTARPTTRRPIPGPNFMIPFGKAKVVREGTDLTVVTYGAVVQRALVAAKEVEESHGRQRRGDRPALAVAGGLGDRLRLGAEDQPGDRGLRGFAVVGLRRGDRGADRRRVPSTGSTRRCARVAATDTFVAYAPELEDVILPQVDSIGAGDGGNAGDPWRGGLRAPSPP